MNTDIRKAMVLAAGNIPVYGYLLNPDEYLMDIGTIEKYTRANEDMNAGRVKIPFE
jgi:NDP-sugar pyrophosphorylase family protein